MPQVTCALLALDDLQRLRMFLCPKRLAPVRRAAEAINEAVQGIGEQPDIRPSELSCGRGEDHPNADYTSGWRASSRPDAQHSMQGGAAGGRNRRGEGRRDGWASQTVSTG